MAPLPLPSRRTDSVRQLLWCLSQYPQPKYLQTAVDRCNGAHCRPQRLFPYHLINQILALGDTHTFSPSLVNEARFGYSRQLLHPFANSDSLINNTGVVRKLEELNIPLTPPITPVPDIVLGSQYSFGPPFFSNGPQMTDAHTAQDNLTKIVGRHSFLVVNSAESRMCSRTRGTCNLLSNLYSRTAISAAPNSGM